MSTQLYSFEYAYEMASTFSQDPITSHGFFDVLMFFYEYEFADYLTYASDYWKYHKVDFVVYDDQKEDDPSLN